MYPLAGFFTEHSVYHHAGTAIVSGIRCLLEETSTPLGGPKSAPRTRSVHHNKRSKKPESYAPLCTVHQSSRSKNNDGSVNGVS